MSVAEDIQLVPPGDSQAEDHQSECEDELMECCGIAPSCLQKAATPGFYVFVLSIFAFNQSMILSGLFPVSITSIQQQFGLSSTHLGLLVAIYDAVVGCSTLILTYYAHSWHKPRLLGRGAVVFVIGVFIFILPVLVGKRYDAPDVANSEVCSAIDGDIGKSCLEGGGNRIYFLFVLGMIVMGLGSCPLYTLGITYVDDNADPVKGPLYLGYFLAATSLGPAVGFLMGGAFQSIYVYPDEEPTLRC